MKPSPTPGPDSTPAGGRLRVLVLTGCYLPGFRGGGPVRSVANMVTALASEIDFRIITLDRDQQSPSPYADVPGGVWLDRDGARVLYLPRAAVTMSRLLREIRTTAPDVIYLNGFFDSVFSIRVLLARRAGLLKDVPVLLAPRGDFSAGALALKRTKKAAYIRLARMLGFCNGVTWQVSSDLERQDVLAMMTNVPNDHVRIVKNLTDDAPAAPITRTAVAGSRPLRVCFLSRISPKKNLDFAIRVLGGVSVPVEFSIYGPVEDADYWAVCQEALARLPGNIKATHCGEVQPAEVRRTLSKHDLFFLPTRGENFGHVIYEALSAGVPVLISDQTPWTDLEAHGAGWSFALDSPMAFAQAIEAVSRMQPEQYAAMAARASAYAAERADRPAAIRRTYELLQSVAAR